MKYYVMVGSFKKNQSEMPDFREAMAAHHAYLKSYKEKGAVLLSGPKAEGRGGIILIRLEAENIQHFIDNDPLVKADIQEYQVTEFSVFDSQEYVKEWWYKF